MPGMNEETVSNKNPFAEKCTRDSYNNKIGTCTFPFDVRIQTRNISECIGFRQALTTAVLLHIQVSPVASTSGSLQNAERFHGAQTRNQLSTE
jgi:hypothetical protein